MMKLLLSGNPMARELMKNLMSYGMAECAVEQSSVYHWDGSDCEKVGDEERDHKVLFTHDEITSVQSYLLKDGLSWEYENRIANNKFVSFKSKVFIVRQGETA